MSLRPVDVGVFALYMLALIGIGVYFTRQQKGLKSYLLADQNIHWIIVAVSVLAALFSGITFLGAPAASSSALVGLSPRCRAGSWGHGRSRRKEAGPNFSTSASTQPNV